MAILLHVYVYTVPGSFHLEACIRVLIIVPVNDSPILLVTNSLLTNPSLYMKILKGSQEVTRTYTLRSNLNPSNSIG